MVAITVVLAATVYVWVSGFGSSSSAAAKSISVTKSASGSIVTFTVTAATPGMKWSDLKFSLSGTSNNYQWLTEEGDNSTGTMTPVSTATITAGNSFYLLNRDTSALSGAKLTILDTNANSVMLTADIVTASAASAAPATLGGTLSITRISGTGTYDEGDQFRVTFPGPIAASSVSNGAADFDFSAGSLGTAPAIQIESPTSVLITVGASPTDIAGATIDVDAGDITYITGSNFAALSGTMP